MSPYPWIEPANPPLPTTSSLPFQLSVGIQSSALMLESDVGLSTIVTRQCCGRGKAAAAGPPAGAPPRPGAAPRACGAPAGAAPRPPPGCTNGPGWTTCTSEIVASGSETERRLSHGVVLTAARSTKLRLPSMVHPLSARIVLAGHRELYFGDGPR